MSQLLKWPRPKQALAIAGAAIALALVGVGGYWMGASRTSVTGENESGRRVLYWYDPMVPDQHFDRPGKSPFMDMELAPRYADEATAEAGVRIDPSVAHNLGVRLAIVERSAVTRSVLAAGVIAFNERSVAVVQARASGFVERTHRRAAGDIIAAGAPIVDLRVPEWTAAQAEYLAVRSAGGEIAAAARLRLAMLGMPAALIERVEREGAPHTIVTITAPIAGAIASLDAREGMTIMAGAPLATISGLSPIWLVVSLPQAEASLARPGGRVTASLPAYPGESFAGRIETVLASVAPATRTIEVRVALDNPRARLRPGMTAEARLEESARPALMIPAEAVIRTGARSIVIVANESGLYQPTEVTLGRPAGDRIEIVTGLDQGQRVVASGQFLIDSEANLSGAIARLNASRTQAGEGAHEASGRITSLSGAQAMIQHDPIASMNWPSMNMQFSLARPELAQGIALGDQVRFSFRQSGQTYLIERMSKTEAPR